MILLGEHASTKAAGIVIVSSIEQGIEEGDTLQCCHCQMHWQVRKGSGKKRTFCYKCMGPTCGKKECSTMCYPQEKKQEHLDKYGRLYYP